MDTGVRGANEEEKVGTRTNKENSAILLGNIPTKHKKQTPKKPFVIEWRMKPERAKEFSFTVDWDQWRAYKRYATEKQRLIAMETLQRKTGDSWEYRLV